SASISRCSSDTPRAYPALGTLLAMAVKGEPMKATLTEHAFSDPGWVFERKLDGVRATIRRTPKRATLTSRTGRQMENYPELTEALEAESAQQFVADGEIVAFEGDR